MTDPGYFERMYANSDDPWHLAENPYEQRKYALTVASLPRERYRRGFEPGCSIGLLTALLAPRCEELVATDPVPEPLVAARARVPAPHVAFENPRLSHQTDTSDNGPSLGCVCVRQYLQALRPVAKARFTSSI